MFRRRNHLHPTAAHRGFSDGTFVGVIATAGFNLGAVAGRGNYRVPDFGVHATIPAGARFVSSALVVGEILSPDDESHLKFNFYFANDVAEFYIVDPTQRAAQIWVRGADAFVETEASLVFPGVAAADLAAVAFASEEDLRQRRSPVSR